MDEEHEPMSCTLKWRYKDGAVDSIELTGENLHEITAKAIAELSLRGIAAEDAWSSNWKD